MLDELGTEIMSVSKHQKVKSTQCSQKYYYNYDNNAHVFLLALLLLHYRLVHLTVRILHILLYCYQVILHRIDKILLLASHHCSHLVHDLIDLVVLLFQFFEESIPFF